MTDLDTRIERAARALCKRDLRRSVGLASFERIWRMVKPEYITAARVALEAADGQETLDDVQA